MADASKSSDLDATDRRIVALLRADGRLSVNEVAQRAHVSRSTAYARVERLRRDGVITGFQATVDPAAVGMPVTALILLNLEQRNWRAVHDALGAIPGVQWSAFTSGAFDMALLVRMRDVQALRDIVLVQLHGLPFVRSSQTVFVLDEEQWDWTRSALSGGEER
ncbi:MAG TPA: Lrp/AsnC family transcriptional regulator [Acidimicrobiales bacterium]|nr:Lrp/AsnC family transcriptional regulator [Acidimicrobiales bacterium]